MKSDITFYSDFENSGEYLQIRDNIKNFFIKEEPSDIQKLIDQTDTKTKIELETSIETTEALKFSEEDLIYQNIIDMSNL